jgi:sialate O-acetylesterase
MWSPSRPLRAGAGLALAIVVLSVTSPVARAQSPALAPREEKVRKSVVVKLKEPTASRVYQRGRDGRAEIPIAIEETKGIEDATVVEATMSYPHANAGGGARFEDGKLVGVPAGGPYQVAVTVRVRLGDGQVLQPLVVDNVFVGDVWVLAGQSNMEGYGDLIDVAPPDERVMVLGMNGKWSRAEEPLHWLVDSPDEVHSGNPADRAARSTKHHKERKKGTGLGLPFATELTRATGLPIGLIAAAHGGTSMEQWSPAKKSEGGKSLYGSMIRQVGLAGGKVKGVLWYQGESDAMNPDAAKVYAKTFAEFIKSVRADLDDPELPFYFVQIGRYVRGGDPKDWNAVQDAERHLAERLPNTAIVASIDLELDDGIHIGTSGQKRLGRRFAQVALRELYGRPGATTPTFDRVNKGSGNTLVVKFKGVNIAPEMTSPMGGRGFGGMGGAGGQGMMSVPVQSGSVVPQAPGRGMMGPGMAPSVGQGQGQGRVVGLQPDRHIAGFSIRKEDGTELPLIFDAAVGPARDTVILKLNGTVPEKSFLWYGHGFDPFCNLVDALDMAVPVFGPIPLDDAR